MNKDQLLNLTLSDMSFKDLLALFKRRRAVFWGVLLSCVGLATLLSLLLPERYQSLSQVILEGKTQANPTGGATNIESALTNVGIAYDVPTQIRILSSFAMIYNALKRAQYPLPARIEQEDFEKLPKVEVIQIGTTQAVQIAVEHTKAEFTNGVASFLPLVYKEFIEDKQRDQVQRSIAFVNARLADERESLRLTEQEAATYKANNGVVDSVAETEARVAAAAGADARLQEAESDLEGAKAALASVQAARASTPATLDIQQTRKNIEAIDRETSKLAELRANREALLVTNFPDSDRVKRIDASIAEQEKFIKNMKETIDISSSTRNPQIDYYDQQVSNARANVQANESRVAAARATAERKRQELNALAPIVAKQRELEGKIVEARETITRLKNLQSDIKIRDNALTSPVTDLTGSTPARKVSPNLPLNIALGVLAGLFLGALASIVRDLSLDRVNTPEEAALMTEREVLSRIPLRSSVRDPIIADPQRARAFEAYRILRSSALLARPGEGSKAFVVTSTIGREGKTTVAGNLAVAMALEGKRTVLVDGNLRKPAVHKLFKTELDKGVSEVVQGTLGLDEALKDTPTPELHVLTAGAEVANPTELVASAGMTKLVEDLKSKFDVVIFDSPPAFGFADTQSLVSQVKDVLYVYQSQAPTKPQMREAVGMIDFAGADIVGLVVNKDAAAARRLR
jgi:capsular exopolysaccharide synthesis family protein